MVNWSKDVVKKFEDKWFSGLITTDHIPDNKVSITIKSPDRSVQDGVVKGWVIPQRHQQLFLPDTIIVYGKDKNTLDMLPIKISDTKEETYKNNVYNVVKSITEFRITPEKVLSFEEIFRLFTKIEHSNKKDFESYLIIILSQIPLKFNWRIATPGGFGKSGLFREICNLLPNNNILKLKSESKVMKEAHKKTSLVFDEFTDVSESVKRELDSFFKISGDGANKIKNPAHGSSAYGTLDEYDTTYTSYGFFYNTYIDAQDKGMFRQYFDNIYDFPTRQRYFPLYFDGEIKGSQFEVPLKKIQEEFNKNERIYINFIKSILYYTLNPEELEKNKENWSWSEEKINSLPAERFKSNFRKILIGIKACSGSEIEFCYRADAMWNSYIKYEEQIQTRINKPFEF